MWTQFMDMHSGGGNKENFEYCYIEASEKEAKIIFYNRFGHSPERVTCTCCGEDYSITESETIEAATAYERNCALEDGKYVEKLRENSYGRGYITLDDYKKKPDVLFIYDKDIKPEERIGEVPEQGYVWQD